MARCARYSRAASPPRAPSASAQTSCSASRVRCGIEAIFRRNPGGAATTADIDRVREHFGVQTILVGHTKVPTITPLYDGRVIAVQVYPRLDSFGNPLFEALLIRDGIRWRAWPDGHEPLGETMITNTQSGTNVHEIAAGIYRINTPVACRAAGAFNFNQYLVVDDEPLLFHTGLRRHVPAGARGGRGRACRSSGCATSGSRTSRPTSAAR